MNPDGDFLNFYGSTCPHGTVRIVGTLAELKEMKADIERAIETGSSGSKHFDSLGEEYHLEILVVPPESADGLLNPYRW